MVPADQAGAAIAATLAQASRTGMTFTSRGSRVFQRNADASVVAEIEDRKLRFLTLIQGSRASEYAPLDWMLPKEQSTIARQLSTAYGIGANPWGELVQDAEVRDLVNPFLGFADAPWAQVEVDAQGRAVKVLVDGQAEVEVLGWTAPLAVAPATNRLLDSDKFGTMTNLSVSASKFYDAIYEFIRGIPAIPGYRNAPLQVLRRMVQANGWPATNTAKGVTITLTDGLGARWKADIVAEPRVVRLKSYQLLAYPPVMGTELANSRLRLGLDALTTAQLISCPQACVLNDKAVPLAFDTALARLAAATGGRATAPTPGPGYPGAGGEPISIGIDGTADAFTLRYATAEEGSCVSIAIRGPGIVVMPSSFQAQPGSVGPFGTCVP